jgi:hypothetical protein
MSVKRLARRVAAYRKLRPRRNTTDATKYLARSPLVGAAVGFYEGAILFSNKVDTRAKYLATVYTSSLIGCPF